MRRSLIGYYAYMLFASMYFSIPVFFLFEQSAGLTFFEIGILEGVFALMIVLFEIPSGAFADRYGRKRALLLSALFTISSYVILSTNFSFWPFLIAQILGGISVAFGSGASEAYLYDLLLHHRQSALYTKRVGLGGALAMGGSALGALIGGWLGRENLVLPIQWTLLPLCISIIAVLLLKEKPVTGAKKLFQESIIFVKEHPIVRKVILYWWIAWALPSAALIVFHQDRAIQLGFSTMELGFLLAGVTVVGALMALFAHRFEKVSFFKYLVISTIILILMELLVAYPHGVTFSIAFLGIYALFGMQYVIIPNKIQQFTHSDKRATVLSIGNLGQQVLLVLLLPLSGLVGTQVDFSLLNITAALLLTLFLVYVLQWRKAFNTAQNNE